MSAMVITIVLFITAALGLATWKAPRMTSVLVWAMVATILVVTVIAMNMPGDAVNNLIGLTLVFPLTWVGFQFWCYWDPSKWRVAAGHICICALSGVVVAISPPLG